MVEGEKIVGLVGLKKQGYVKIESEFSLLMHFLSCENEKQKKRHNRERLRGKENYYKEKHKQ